MPGCIKEPEGSQGNEQTIASRWPHAVLVADGRTWPIDAIAAGDMVAARDPLTGRPSYAGWSSSGALDRPALSPVPEAFRRAWADRSARRVK